MMRREKVISSVVWGLMMTLTVLQVILSLFLYNRPHLGAIRNVGWIILWIAGLFGVVPIFTLRKKGGVAKGRDYTHTTALVDSGIHGVVRHPQYLSFMLINLGLLLIAQQWLTAVMGVVAMALNYQIMVEADQAGIEKFGEEYRRYMQRVPRMNFLAGVIRLARHRQSE
jgi:protein-S-isoprenylcysteine O-methyltransferase Ste14